MSKPRFRSGTRVAIDKIVKELDMPFDDLMQDWPYEIVDSADIDKYIVHYQKAADDDEKFVLMQAIIQATEDQSQQELFLKYLEIMKYLLQIDFYIHEYTVYYWSCFETEDIEDCFKVSTFMRELFTNEQNEKKP